jgi:hypothetical protein
MMSRKKQEWLIDAIGYLMLATLPRRDKSESSAGLSVHENFWSPSLEARRFAESQNRKPWALKISRSKNSGKVTTRHVPIDGPEMGLGGRSTLLEMLKREATVREMKSTVAPDIVEAFWATFRQAEADARTTDEREWLPNFNFRIRGWRSSKTEGHAGAASAVKPEHADYNGQEPINYTKDEPAPQPPGEEAGPSGSKAVSGRRTTTQDTLQLRYYTVGNVGDHRFRADLWAIADDGKSGFDVYDVTGRFRGHEAILHRRHTYSTSLTCMHLLKTFPQVPWNIRG